MICAYKQSSKNTGRVLKRALAEYKPEMHRFGTFGQLTGIAASKTLEMIFLGGMGALDSELALVKKIRSIPLLTYIPLILQHPGPTNGDLDRALASPVDEVLVGPLSDPTVFARLSLAVRRCSRDISVNPSSWLPGPSAIEEVISEQIKKQSRFAVCYADLDDFKAYNDYYGYFSGDKVIKMAAQVIRDVVYENQRSGFVGHIGGDDFIFVIDATKVKTVCNEVIRRFNQRIPAMYEPRDLKNGFIISRSRRGSRETYPIMSISIAVVINKNKMFKHVGEISHMIADLKSYAKSLPGSNYVIERRQKY